MRAQYFAIIRRFRRQLVTVAIGLVLLQALVAGLATAHAANIAAAGMIDAGLICRSANTSAADHEQIPNADDWKTCCAYCIAQVSALVDMTPLGMAAVVRAQNRGKPVNLGGFVQIAPRAVRAGLSQAPPSLACA